MNKYPFRVASVHDLHLGHRKTKAVDVIARFDALFTVEYLKTIDLLLFPGDLLDSALQYSDPTVIDIEQGFARLLARCEEARTDIKIVKGTPSHDGDQPAHLVKLHELMGCTFSLTYHKDMVIEIDTKHDISVMYVPDEWASREEMYLEAVRLLEQHGLEQVDFIIGHNQFGYQFNDILRPRISHLNEDDWEKMIRHHAFFGHVHKRSQYGKIQVAGSFDRLAHGEEESKGFLEVTYFNEKEFEIKFIENKEAECFTTLKLPVGYSALDPTHFNQLSEQLSQLPHTSGHIRLKYANAQLPIKDIVMSLKQSHPYFHYTVLCLDETTNEQTQTLLPEETPDEYLVLTRDNIVRLIEEQCEDPIKRQAVSALASRYLEGC